MQDDNAFSSYIAQVSVDHNAALEGEELDEIELHQLPLLEKSGFVRALVGRSAGGRPGGRAGGRAGGRVGAPTPGAAPP